MPSTSSSGVRPMSSSDDMGSIPIDGGAPRRTHECADTPTVSDELAAVGVERAHVVRALVGSRIGAVLVAEAALHLLDRDVVVGLHPRTHAVDHRSEMAGAALQQRRG